MIISDNSKNQLNEHIFRSYAICLNVKNNIIRNITFNDLANCRLFKRRLTGDY